MNCFRRWNRSSSSSKAFFERDVLKLSRFYRERSVVKCQFCKSSGQRSALFQVLPRWSSHGLLVGSLEQLLLKAFMGDCFRKNMLNTITWWWPKGLVQVRSQLNDDSFLTTSFQTSLYDCIQLWSCSVGNFCMDTQRCMG